LLAHRRHDGIDRRTVRFSIRGLGGDIGVEIGPDQGAVRRGVPTPIGELSY
jgi:hypothetical protein